MTEKNSNLLTHKQSRTCLEILALATLTTNKTNVYFELIKSVSDLTPARCIKEGTQVVSLKNSDRDKLEKLIIEAINFVNLTCNVSKKMNDFQVLDATVTLISEYWFLKVEEIVKALNNGRTEKYGEIFRLDIGTLCGWVDSYVNSEREQGLEEIRSQPREVPERELVSEEKLKEYREQFDKLMLQVQNKKNKDKVVFDEKYWKESFQNNLPLLDEEGLMTWKKTLSKDEKMSDLLELVNSEIEYRRNKK